MALGDNKVLFDSANSAYWNAETWAPDTELVPFAADQLEGSMVSVVFTRSVPASVQEDRALWSLHLAVEAGPGAPMVPLTASQAADVEASLSGAFFTSGIGSYLTNQWTLSEYQWRNYGADYPRDKNDHVKPGPIWRITPKALVGLSAGTRMPDQVSATVTYRTASREHWGRSYLGGIPATAMETTSGKFSTAFCDTISEAFKQLFLTMEGFPAITRVWIWSPKHRGAMSIREIAVDNVPDVIRSRRAKFATYRSVETF